MKVIPHQAIGNELYGILVVLQSIAPSIGISTIQVPCQQTDELLPVTIIPKDGLLPRPAIVYMVIRGHIVLLNYIFTRHNYSMTQVIIN